MGHDMPPEGELARYAAGGGGSNEPLSDKLAQSKGVICVPSFEFPNIKSWVGLSAWPIFCAAPAWSTRDRRGGRTREQLRRQSCSDSLTLANPPFRRMEFAEGTGTLGRIDGRQPPC
jgi:hypothetical protein